MDIKVEDKTIFLSGVIDENASFEKIGTLSSGFEFDCGEIKKINSNGVKLWISFFSKVPANITLKNLSPVLVEQLNSLSNFTGTATVKTVQVPFACTQCKKETIRTMTVEELKKNPEPDPIFCKHCNGRAEFDDLPEEYFCFLENL